MKPSKQPCAPVITDPASRPAFLITIDTEGDNLWSKPHTITTRNSGYVPRLQSLCEHYGLKPTYLTNWEMVHCPDFLGFARDALSRSVAEVGMHLHAWNSPPIVPLTADDFEHQPYLIEYPEPQLREKVKVMTAALEERFGRKMISHRAGRWAIDTVYARALLDNGYSVDCSVTPHVSWRMHFGDPAGRGGADYSSFPEDAYFFTPGRLDCPHLANGTDGERCLLELPMTVVRPRLSAGAASAKRLLLAGGRIGARLSHRLFAETRWLRPRGDDRREPLRALKEASAEHRPFVEFMLHSSELMPGGSPRFPDERSVEALYDDLDELFSWANAHGYVGCTLAQYRERLIAAPADPVGEPA